MKGSVAEFMRASPLLKTFSRCMWIINTGQLMFDRLEQQGRGLYRQVRCLVAGASLGTEPHVA